MKKRLVTLLFLLVSIFAVGCAEEVLPVDQKLERREFELLDDERSTDAEEEDEGVDPNVG